MPPKKAAHRSSPRKVGQPLVSSTPSTAVAERRRQGRARPSSVGSLVSPIRSQTRRPPTPKSRAAPTNVSSSSSSSNDDAEASPIRSPTRSPPRPSQSKKSKTAPTNVKSSSKSKTAPTNVKSSSSSNANVGITPTVRPNPPIRQRKSIPKKRLENSTRRPVADEEPNQRKKKRSTILPRDVFKKRYRPANSAMKEIRFFQTTTHDLIPKAPFARLVRELTATITGCPDLRYKSTALDALHNAAETYLVGIFEDAFLLSLHAKRVTLFPKDLALAYKIRGDELRM